MNNRLLPKSLELADSIQILGSPKLIELDSVIRCLVWNIYKARRLNWRNDFNDLCADRDLVLLQEAVVNAPTDSVFDLCERYEWIMAGSHQHPVNGVVTGVKTGCIAKAASREVYRSNYSEPVVKTQKQLLETHYALANSNSTLMVLNMHAINFVSVMKYVDQLDQLSTALASHCGPVILAGDFNTWNPKRLAHFKSVACNARLSEANMTRCSKIKHFHQHLDHVFYRGLSLRSVQSLQHISSSDHAPITATFYVE